MYCLLTVLSVLQDALVHSIPMPVAGSNIYSTPKSHHFATHAGQPDSNSVYRVFTPQFPYPAGTDVAAVGIGPVGTHVPIQTSVSAAVTPIVGSQS